MAEPEAVRLHLQPRLLTNLLRVLSEMQQVDSRILQHPWEMLQQAVVYIKAIAILLVLWRILTIGAFGQVVSGILAATLAYSLTRRSNSIPQQVKDIAAPLNDLKRSVPFKLTASLIIDVLSTQYIAVPWFLKLVVGQAGWVPIGTFLLQFLYDRPALTAIDLLRVQVPFAEYIPSATIGWLIEQNIIKEQWLGGSRGPFQKV